MTPVEVLEKRRDELMLDATEAEGFAAQQEANARQYRGTAAERRQEAADIDAAILSLQQPWKAAPVPEPITVEIERVTAGTIPPPHETDPALASVVHRSHAPKGEDFEDRLVRADKLFKAGKKVA
jgi:hypothetical protein